MTRPEDLIDAVDERPPWPRLAFLGAQDAVIALAISTVLQGLWKGPVGSGYLALPGIFLLWLGRLSDRGLPGPDGGAVGEPERRNQADVFQLTPGRGRVPR